MAVWFEGEARLECDLQRVKDSVERPGEHFVGVVSLMPGMTSVELITEDGDSVAIRTNEGVMRRTNIARQLSGDAVALDFDEEYEAGSKITATAHYSSEFAATEGGVSHKLVISGVEASGFLGFFYRKLGSENIGNAVLDAYKAFFEEQDD